MAMASDEKKPRRPLRIIRRQTTRRAALAPCRFDLHGGRRTIREPARTSVQRRRSPSALAPPAWSRKWPHPPKQAEPSARTDAKPSGRPKSAADALALTAERLNHDHARVGRPPPPVTHIYCREPKLNDRSAPPTPTPRDPALACSRSRHRIGRCAHTFWPYGVLTMYVIRQQRGKEVVWLVSPNPERWGEQDRAMRFETRGDARRVALAIAVWGDWSINAAGAAPPHVRSWF
jgi:hypothetical protein